MTNLLQFLTAHICLIYDSKYLDLCILMVLRFYFNVFYIIRNFVFFFYRSEMFPFIFFLFLFSPKYSTYFYHRSVFPPIDNKMKFSRITMFEKFLRLILKLKPKLVYRSIGVNQKRKIRKFEMLGSASTGKDTKTQIYLSLTVNNTNKILFGVFSRYTYQKHIRLLDC